MKLSDKCDALTQRIIALEDEKAALKKLLQEVHGCASAKQARELDAMAESDPTGRDSSLAIQITPAVWHAIKRTI